MEIVHVMAENVRRLRLAKGWSQEELADRAGLHRTFISQVERALKASTIETVARIAAALEVRPGSLIDSEG